jgi:hypothetical protein
MDFESLKEQAIDRFFELKNKVEDSEVYIRLKERYDNLNPNAQLGVKIVSGIIALLLIYSLPASYLSSAREKMEYFEDNRQLTRDLIRAGRSARTLQLPPSAPSQEVLTNMVDSALEREKVLPEQKAGTTPKSDIVEKSIVPTTINQIGLKTSVKKLNLRQVIKIGESLHQTRGARLMNIAIQADSKDPHFYNVDFEVAAFSVPQAEESAPEQKGKARGRFQRGGSN